MKLVSKKNALIASVIAILVPATCMAQEAGGKTNLFQKAKNWIDKPMMVHGVDTNYIKTPRQPWQISVKSRVAQTDLQMHSSVNGGELFDGEGMMPFIMGVGNMDTDPRFMTKVSTSIGVKVGYKGLSASYSFPVGGDKSNNLSLKCVGNKYSVNLRWHSYKTDVARIHYAGMAKAREVEYKEQTEELEFSEWGAPESWNYSEKETLPSPIKVKTLIFDGFYIFNSEKFSYAAAYNQKTIQARSAGSPIAGVMGYYADFKYNENRNAELIYWMDGIGRLRQYQLGVGAGYAYNFVPAKGWLISAMAMPMLTVVNRTRVNTYSSNFKDLAKEHLLGYLIVEALKEEGVEGLDDVDMDYTDDCKIQSTGVHSRNNRIALNFTTRLSVTYNWSRYFINANGQFNNFNFKQKAMHGHLNDWYINASVGVRL